MLRRLLPTLLRSRLILSHCRPGLLPSNRSTGGAQVAATEPLPLYLLADAGLDNVTPEAFMEASEEGSDAPAAVVQQALELLDGGAVKALLLNTQTQTPATDRMQQAADDAGVAVLEVNETLPDGSNGYVDWMGEQIDGLATALDQSR